MKLKSYHKTPCFYPDGSVNFYTPQLVSTTDYYAFGQIINARTHSTSGQKYRYNHNGHEIEDDIADGVVSAEFWMYDGRLGRRWEVDPIDYESESPYATFSNNPILLNDPLGLADGTKKTKTKRGKGTFHNKGKGKYLKNRIKEGKSENKLAKFYLSVKGFFRQAFTGAKNSRMLIPQGRNRYGNVELDPDDIVNPGSKGEVHNIKKLIHQNILNNSGVSPFSTTLVGIYGGIYNGEASYNPLTNTWSNEGDIHGYAKVEGVGGGTGWYTLFMNTGFRGFIQSRIKNPPIGYMDVGSETIPGLNFIDDALGNIFGFLKGLGIANKQNTWFRSTTAIRVVNASFTKRAVAYHFNIRYRYWQRVQNFGSTSQRSKMWQKLHKIAR